MTTVQSTAQTGATTAIVHGEDLDDSVAAVLSMLSGKKVNTTSLANMKISEDVLYAGLVYDSLVQESGVVARTFKEELKTRFDRRTERNDSQPLAKAINDILDNAVKAKSITQKRSDAIVRDALGNAQLDKHKGALSRTAKKGGFETFEKAVTKNVEATAKTATKFETQMNTASFIKPSTARHQRKELDKIIQSLSEKTVSDPEKPETSNTEPPKTETPKKTETETAAKVPSILDEQNPYQFVYDPRSEKDGNILVAIPVNFAREVKGVSLFDDDGKVVTDLKHSGLTKDGRRNFRADESGEHYKSAYLLRMVFADGTDYDFLIESGDKPFVKQYA